MRNDICTIPVNEAFEENDGCPMCRMYKTVENRITDYIMGAAMMEPDVRISTNEMGFCEKHYTNMMSKRGRLQLALMLESHIDEVGSKVLKDNLVTLSKEDNVKKLNRSCFICSKIEWGFSRMLETIYRTYENDSDFRRMFDEQKMFCMPHFELLKSGANKKNMKVYHKDFLKNLNRITKGYCENLHKDMKHYCSMYDYRSGGKDANWGTSKDAVERTIAFLTGNDNIK
ncbi:MAG: hypothetical protein E7568_06615 [Ruminococcaceae bacterium]|nr:hypothetical protein [Oscillospiraceae bacterium]